MSNIKRSLHKTWLTQRLRAMYSVRSFRAGACRGQIISTRQQKTSSFSSGDQGVDSADSKRRLGIVNASHAGTS